ncbi:MAG: helix-turn-helix domain-containing protein [Candidatus Poribacteria bacterium]|nr:helix-turn-helix domain-containing protein [Candidatus Poribacteria bacterium]
MNCPRCKREDAVKNGKVRGSQRYKCKACGFQFTRLTTRGRPPWQRALAVFLYCRGVSISTIARMFSVAPSTIFKWIRKFGSKRTPLPESTDGAVLLDENEIRQYLEKQSAGSESGKIFVVIPEDVLSENVVVGIKRD